MNIIDECLVASLDDHPDDEDIKRLQKKVLSRIEDASIRAVLIDMSRVRILDSTQFSFLVDAAKTFALMGAKTIFVGFQAGVASSLAHLDLDLGSIETVVTMEDGLEQLRSFEPAESEEAEFEESETENFAADGEAEE